MSEITRLIAYDDSRTTTIRCWECGMTLANDERYPEYHPYEYCTLRKLAAEADRCATLLDLVIGGIELERVVTP